MNMKNKYKLISLLLVVGLVGCNQSPKSNRITKTFSLTYEGGCPIYNLGTTVTLIDDTLSETVGELTANEQGKYTFESEKDHQYHVEVSLAKGYSYVEENPSFTFTGDTLDVKVTSAVIEEEKPTDYKYGYFNQSTMEYPEIYVGKLMYDFSMTTIRNESISLAETLKTKKMVLLNFWATWCGPCANEFPALGEVYEQYKDDISIFAMSYETLSLINKYVKSRPYMTFNVGKNPDSLDDDFAVTYIPTSVIIDRYGRIADYVIGGISDDSVWKEAFAHYSADDYVPSLSSEGSEDEEVQ